MLEKMPRVVGHALEGVRAGLEKTVSHSSDFAGVSEIITIESSAFAAGTQLPARFTEDGAKVSPPLSWRGVPPEAASLVLIVEDPDAPTPDPLVHCIAWALPPGDGSLDEGALKTGGAADQGIALGKNSFMSAEYLPPDPPTGHGSHRYLFQLFALDRRLDLPEAPGRSAVVDGMRGHVIGRGTLIGLYERP